MDIWGMFPFGGCWNFLRNKEPRLEELGGLFCTHVLVDDSNDMMFFFVGMRKTFPTTQSFMGIILLFSYIFSLLLSLLLLLLLL